MRSFASRFALFIGLGIASSVTGGCASTANVSSDLPLSRVVIYRNGVGYFERTGEVEGDEVRFKMKSQRVGDFLATLAIVQRGGSAVRAASFPLEIEDDEETPPGQDPRLYSMLKPLPPPEQPPKSQRDMKDVVLKLDGGRHLLSLGYVAETPVWRPSYRLVVQKDGKADLQAWGIVHNLSGEDWNDVKLVLVAGAPLAFEATLGTPVVPQRPVVTDQGEVIAAVPEGLTSLKTEPAPMQPAEEAVAMDEDYAEMDADDGYGYAFGGRATAAPAASGTAGRPSGGAEAMKKDAPSAAPPPAPERRRMISEAELREGLSQPRNVSALAGIAVDTGTTRYSIPNAVSLPNESATMVLLVSSQVPGEAMFLFSPDGGVPESGSHPFRVARFKNSTAGLLERGPIAVFQGGSFLGQGMVEPLPPKASATVPFALERSLVVTSERKTDRRNARLMKIENGQLMVERDNVYETTYSVKNGGGDHAKLLLKHPRFPGGNLFEPPKGTEEEAHHALVPIEVPGHQDGKVMVEERQPSQEWAAWTSDLAREAVEAFLKAPGAIDAERVARLRTAWEVRGKVKVAEDELRKLQSERNMLENFSREDRLKLKSLEKNRFADDLRRTLTARLTENTRRMEEIEKRLVEVSLTLEEQRIRFDDALRGLRIVISQPDQR
ncbi:MAG: DUF4139 domain-containing protein [Polyangiaceae bacterium]|nr:DUF4139 domain-containing protein [Polyangiaceae bacterium]MCW5791380.1 DUF4139 domain-containing protein [Polyangiaceae bacterium]